MSASNEWPIPEGLCADGQRAAEVIRDFLIEKDATYHGGGGRFYTPQQWKARGEEYGWSSSILVVTHDGGEHARFFNLDYEAYKAHDEFRNRLAEHGFWMEACTCWYAAIYKRD
ncbi:hypothetical protein [Mycolicibacterium sp.]|uniref:hypothetical protein n=1 Tax=Mycolicibacterium sp. TaxID=2320850 RepID=UPI0037C6F218